MRQITLKELKEIQLQILDVVDAFCKKNKINYWIDCGTLLGAVRHQGYIPWDDDIDIGMLRPDYNKFINSFNKSGGQYRVYSIENNTLFPYPFAKVLDMKTTLYEPNEKGVKLAVYIDVFVYDNAPDDDTLLNKMYDKYFFLKRLHTRRVQDTAIRSVGKHKILKNIGKEILKKIISETYFAKKIASHSQKYIAEATRYIGDFTSGDIRLKAPKHIVGQFANLMFEGKEYPVPIEWNEWLRLLYGDYMALPPIEKRKTTHQFVAYVED